jgi:hypothetical protein
VAFDRICSPVVADDMAKITPAAASLQYSVDIVFCLGETLTALSRRILPDQCVVRSIGEPRIQYGSGMNAGFGT